MNSMEGSSCDRQEDGDDSSILERPHKKARFAWQIKGKQLSKNEMLTSSNDCLKKSELGETSATFETEGHNKGNSESSPRLEDSLLNQENSLETDNQRKLGLSWAPSYIRAMNVFPDSNAILPQPQWLYNKHDSALMEIYSNPPLLEEECIARWQARQLITSSLDNTTNHFLVSCSVPHEHFIATVDNNVENEGILMAISAHGLQSASSSSSCSYSENQNEESSKDMNVSLEPQISKNDDQDTQTQKNEDISVTNDDFRINVDINDTDTNATINMEESEGNSLSPIFPDSSSSSSLYNSNIIQPEIYEDDFDTIGFAMSDFNSSFINAAVTYAIQNKGLTSKTEFG